METEEKLDVPTNEQKTLEFWKEHKCFAKQTEVSKALPEFVFYDGPPFATGLPHFGNILAGYVKDTVCRFAVGRGQSVERRFGWDCHGLPVENEINKKLGVSSPADVLEKVGVAAYNAECRAIVLRCAAAWETIMTRLGRWIDFRNDYKTMDPAFMESVWWVFGTLFEKGLVYRGFKVMPYSTGLNTPLSNFEANNYQEVRDPEVVVEFQLTPSSRDALFARLALDRGAWDEVALLAWTTTPWTLPSNLFVCVSDKLLYVAFAVPDRPRALFVVAKDRLEATNKRRTKDKTRQKVSVVKTFAATEFVGLAYSPLYPHSLQQDVAVFGTAVDNWFKVYTAAFVSADTGTGVVQCAPAFGEDDFEVGKEKGVVETGKPVLCPVDETGCFSANEQTTAFSSLVGLHVKKADAVVVADLQRRGAVWSKGTVVHSYPFCERSKQPLIYKAVPCWFLRVTALKEKLLQNNLRAEWVPKHVQLKRFQNWLENARDWAISRTRFWGTPLPVWTTEDFSKVVVVKSVAELRELTGAVDFGTDLHTDKVDALTFEKDGERFRRVEDVFDCWFESGSMPYGSRHFPFAFGNTAGVENFLPADFVAEGIDQTRGWFYTLLVLSTALFDKPPFKNLIVHGLVLAADGKKMSKHLKNFSDPMEVVEKHGADPLRLYLIGSPAVRGDFLRFKEAEIGEFSRKLLRPTFNALRFLLENLRPDFVADDLLTRVPSSSGLGSVLDSWVLTVCQRTVNNVCSSMAAYKLYEVVEQLLAFVEDLTNVYVRLSRERLRGKKGEQERRDSCCVLLRVLFDFARLLAPFTPFFAEQLFQKLAEVLPSVFVSNFALDGKTTTSVHFLRLPEIAQLAQSPLEKEVRLMKEVLELARTCRDKARVSTKQPLREVCVFAQTPLSDLLVAVVKEEVNVKRVQQHGLDSTEVSVRLQPLQRGVGQTFGKESKAVFAFLAAFATNGENPTQVRYTDGRVLRVDEHYEPRIEHVGKTSGVVALANRSLCVALDTVVDAALKTEGRLRFFKSFVQRLKKTSGIKRSDAVRCFVSDWNETGRLFAEKTDELTKLLDMPVAVANSAPKGLAVQAQFEFEDAKTRVFLTKD